MPYIIGFSQKRIGPVSEAEFATAQQALKEHDPLVQSDETIRYIKAPWGGEIGRGELLMKADQEVHGKNG